MLTVTSQLAVTPLPSVAVAVMVVVPFLYAYNTYLPLLY